MTDRPAFRFVTPAWLQGELGAPDLAIVDGTWHLPTAGRSGAAEFLEAHIPGAVFFDLDRMSDASSSLPHMMPRPEDFAAAVGALGIAEDMRIVVYDAIGLFSAARVAWMFAAMGARAVMLLEGGLPAWRAAGRPVEAGAPKPAPKTFHASFDRTVVADLATVQEALADGEVQVVDARPADRFAGDAPEPRPGVRPGHMPGSLNVPFGDVVGPDGRLRSPAEIEAALAKAGVDPDQPMITSCGSGVSAVLLAAAVASIGRPLPAIYDGSWAEWGSRHDLPVVTGPK